jgi:LysR family transcriptional regulator, regulator for metE and metH
MAQLHVPRLEARHYILLEAISRLGSMSAAANELGVTPSAVTHRIREAERRLGVALTTRIGSRIELTVSGQRLAQSASRALDELSRAELDAERIGLGAGRIVRLCMGTYSFFHWLPSFLGRLSAIDPTVQIEIIGGTPREPLRLLHDDAVDLALIPGPLREEKRIVFIPMPPDELICVTAASHPLASRPFIEADDLTAETHLTYSAVVTEGFEYERFFRPAGRYPARLVPFAVPEAVQELVAANLGISILSKWSALPRLQRGEIAGTRLTRNGLTLDWHVALRQAEDASSPASICAAALALWEP